ncbi:thioredoxin domain-containing protein 3-like protein, partial [Plakobranchus ocellatus]
MFMVLSREDAVAGWRRELGDTDPEQAKTTSPASIRAQFGQDVLNNAAHGSSNAERAMEEMRAVFGELNFNPDGTVQGEQPELDEAVVVVEKEHVTAAADVAPEYRTHDGETTMDETSVDPTADTTATAMDATVDETQDMTTVDETQEVTADTTQ